MCDFPISSYCDGTCEAAIRMEEETQQPIAMTPAVPDPTVEALIAEVLGGHVSWTDAAAGCMGCGWKPDNADYAGVKHRAHVAAVLAPLLAARAAAPDALRVRIEALVDAHHLTTPVQCVCGWRETDPGAGTYGGHIAALLEGGAR